MASPPAVTTEFRFLSSCIFADGEILQMKKLQNLAWVAVAALVVVPVLTQAGSAQPVYTVLRNLGTMIGDPINPGPIGTFAQGRDGNLYSTIPFGGTHGLGAVIQLTPAGVMTVLHNFNTTDGARPNSGLTLGTDGNLYGTTSVGGLGFGTVFKITTAGAFKSLHSFNGSTEGELPNAPPVQGLDGNFYGTTSNGFNAVTGTVYRITPAGALTTIHTFSADIRQPISGLVLGTDGSFYGTTVGGPGVHINGTIYKITPKGVFTPLHDFDGTHGKRPQNPLIQGNDGNFYGTTSGGGPDGLGVIYKMTPAGVTTDIHDFHQLDGLGYSPFAGLVQATDGKFYGATLGPAAGKLFQVTSTGTYAIVHSFNGTQGQSPQVAPYQHTGGTLYGDTNGGGTGNMGCVTCGVLYSLNMGLGKFVSFVSPLFSGKVGKTIEILGQGFTGTTKVSFNGTAATFAVVSDTYMTAIVPTGATTGFVTVTTPSGARRSNRTFRVTPQITSFDPPSGAVGAQVTITGLSLKQTTKVTFGGVKATSFTADSDIQVTATVPVGAITGKIAVSTAGGSAASATNFSVTP